MQINSCGKKFLHQQRKPDYSYLMIKKVQNNFSLSNEERNNREIRIAFLASSFDCNLIADIDLC